MNIQTSANVIDFCESIETHCNRYEFIQ